MFALAAKVEEITSEVESLFADPTSVATPQEKKVGKIAERSAGHWSLYVQELGCVVGLIVGIASFIMGQYVLIGAGLTMAALSGLAIYQLNDMRYLKTVQEYIDILSTKVSQIGLQVVKIKETDQHIQEDIKVTKDVAVRYEEAVKKAEKALGDKIKELEKVKNELGDKEKELERVSKKLPEIYQKINGAANHMEEEVQGFSKQHELLQTDVKQFFLGVQSIDMQVNKVETEIGQLDVQSKEFTLHLTQIDQVMNKLQGLIELQKKLHQASLDVKLDLSKLDETDDKVEDSALLVEKSSIEVRKATENEKMTAERIELIDVERYIELGNKMDLLIENLEKKGTKGTQDAASKSKK